MLSLKVFSASVVQETMASMGLAAPLALVVRREKEGTIMTELTIILVCMAWSSTQGEHRRLRH
jgi:hypothetical protein